MASRKNVTVIVPIYNVAQYLDQCILSILRQSYKDMQIILVNDGSTDDSGSICDRYRKLDERILVIHKKNEGLVKARKTGLSKATGEYICYVDADDWIETDMIEQLVNSFAETGVQLVVSNYYSETEKNTQKVCGKWEEGICYLDSIVPAMLYTGEFYEFGISQFVWAKLFRKDLLWKIQMQVDDRIHCGEDVAVTYPYILQTHKIYFLEYAGYHYRQRRDSMTNQWNADEAIQNKILLRFLNGIFRHTAYADSLLKQLNQYAKNLLLVRQIGCLDSSDEDMVLQPYGGIAINSRIVLYGAGKMGQSIYHYLKRMSSVKIIAWLDRDYLLYYRQNDKISSPEKIMTMDAQEYDFVIMAISNLKAANDAGEHLKNMGVEREKLRCIDREFIKEENFILDKLLD